MRRRSSPQRGFAARPVRRIGNTTLIPAAALAAVALAGIPCQSAGEIYRWVDETGATVYSQRPPPGTAATTIKPDPAPSAAEVSRASERMHGLIEQDLDKREDQTRAADESRKKAAEQAPLKPACEAARKNLDTLRKRGRLPLRTPDGKAHVFSDDELAKRIDETQAQIKANCN